MAPIPSPSLPHRMNPRRTPAPEKSGSGALGRLQVVEVRLDVIIQAPDINPVIGRAVVLQAHQPLGEEVNRPLRGATVEAEVQAGREADQPFVKGFLFFCGLVPGVFQDLVTRKILSSVKQRNGIFEFRMHRWRYPFATSSYPFSRQKGVLYAAPHR